MTTITEEAIGLLQSLIATPSYSGEESGTALLIHRFLASKGIPVQQHKNNVWAINAHFAPGKPTLLLCSHHDTVRPNAGYTRDPFAPDMHDGRLYGLGSNDAGGALVSMIAAFTALYAHPQLPCNIVLAAVAEEERSGKDGIESLWPLLPPVDCAIIGEPTLLQLAVAERGLMVLDGVATGTAGHAAHQTGENALYKAIEDIAWLKQYRFPKISEWLGPVKMTVTSIETPNKAHNVIPDVCRFVVDVRLTEQYALEEILAVLRQHVRSELTPRSTRLRATGIATDHPLVRTALRFGGECYGSPTSSDKALLPVPTLKAGPGDSTRSHTADEYIFSAEIEAGIAFYHHILTHFEG